MNKQDAIRPGGANARISAHAEPSVILMTRADPPVLNEAAFERNAAFLPREAVSSYLRTIAQRSEALLRDLDDLTGKGEPLADAAHALAGSAGMFGFERLATTAERFEYALLSDPDQVLPTAARLRTALAATRREIVHRLPWPVEV